MIPFSVRIYNSKVFLLPDHNFSCIQRWFFLTYIYLYSISNKVLFKIMIDFIKKYSKFYLKSWWILSNFFFSFPFFLSKKNAIKGWNICTYPRQVNPNLKLTVSKENAIYACTRDRSIPNLKLFYTKSKT